MKETSTQNQCHIIAEVTGSNPVSPTIVYNRANCFQVRFFIIR